MSARSAQVKLGLRKGILAVDQQSAEAREHHHRHHSQGLTSGGAIFARGPTQASRILAVDADADVEEKVLVPELSDMYV